MYNKYPHFLRSNSTAGTGGIAAVKASKSSASLATSQVPVHDVSASSSCSVRSSSSGVSARNVRLELYPRAETFKLVVEIVAKD